MGHNNFLLAILLLTTYIYVGHAKEAETYNSTETRALKEFRPLVLGLLKKDYEKMDIYLIHWLRARNYDVKLAKAMLQQSMLWRKENRLDGILEEQAMIDFVKLYPGEYGVAKDKKGRPTYQAVFGKWDIRKGVLAGHNFERFLSYSYERTVSLAFKQGYSEWNFVVDMGGFNLRQHACVACVSFYIDLVNIYEKNYPNTARIIYLLNTPRTFETILQIITRLQSPHTRKAMKVFGLDKAEWQPYMLREFNANELTPIYGGTKVAPNIEK